MTRTNSVTITNSLTDKPQTLEETDLDSLVTDPDRLASQVVPGSRRRS